MTRYPPGQWPVAVVASQVEYVSITVVSGRVVGKRKPRLPQPGAMADASNVRHDAIVVPETTTHAQVRCVVEGSVALRR